jgi:hypothetical protein
MSYTIPIFPSYSSYIQKTSPVTVTNPNKNHEKSPLFMVKSSTATVIQENRIRNPWGNSDPESRLNKSPWLIPKYITK